MTAKEMSEKLGFPYYIINNKKKQLGLTKKMKPREFAREDYATCLCSLTRILVSYLLVKKRYDELIEYRRFKNKYEKVDG